MMWSLKEKCVKHSSPELLPVLCCFASAPVIVGGPLGTLYLSSFIAHVEKDVEEHTFGPKTPRIPGKPGSPVSPCTSPEMQDFDEDVTLCCFVCDITVCIRYLPVGL